MPDFDDQLSDPVHHRPDRQPADREKETTAELMTSAWDEERRVAIEAVTAAEEKYGAAARDRRGEVDSVLEAARARALRNYDAGKPTTVEYEVVQAAERRAKARAKAKGRREAYKAAHTPQFLRLESKFSQIMRLEHEILRLTEGVDFDEDAREIMSDTLCRFKAQMQMVDQLVLNRPDDANIDDELDRMAEGQS